VEVLRVDLVTVLAPSPAVAVALVVSKMVLDQHSTFLDQLITYSLKVLAELIHLAPIQVHLKMVVVAR
tara:strand:- start:518 stop:721 length:204 start_codon:yes stop_codon:yes gene_type:complete